MWVSTSRYLMGETVRNMLHAEVSGVTMLLLLFVPLLVCLLQFADRQGGRQAFRCEYQCRSGVGTEEYGSGHLAHPHLPESSCCRSTGCRM